jgi:hypothetical protein
LLADLPNIIHSRRQQSVATSEITLEWPGSIVPFLVMPGSTFIALVIMDVPKMCRKYLAVLSQCFPFTSLLLDFHTKN